MNNHHGDRVTKQIRLSLPNATGALSTFTTAVSSAGGIVGEVRTLRNHTQRRVVQLDILATSEQQWAAIRQALMRLEHVQVDAETDPTLDAHRGGLIGVQSIVPFCSEEDFTTFYTSGAISTARTIAQSPHLVPLYSAIPRLVALVTNGENIPRLGEIDPRAVMPLLEGKAVLLNTMLMLSGVPILLDTRDPHEIVRTLAHIAPTFAAIVVEGIAAPACFSVEEALVAQFGNRSGTMINMGSPWWCWQHCSHSRSTRGSRIRAYASVWWAWALLALALPGCCTSQAFDRYGALIRTETGANV